MEELNQKILTELKKDSRQTNIKLAKKLKVSEGTIRQRINKLIKKGTIKKFTIQVSTKTGFRAFALLKTRSSIQTEKIVSDIKKIDDVKEIYEMCGVYDVIVEISTYSAESFNNRIEKIRKINGVLSTESLVILKVS